jgi:hemerythrin-like metal-binding protein
MYFVILRYAARKRRLAIRGSCNRVQQEVRGVKLHSSMPAFEIDLIDKGHEQLFEIERRLMTFCGKGLPTCESCGVDTQNECEKPFVELLEQLLVVMWEHFRDEESLMSCLPPEPAQAHKYEHAEISKIFSSILTRSPQTGLLSNRRELAKILGFWLHDHVDNWDMPLARQIKRHLVGTQAPQFDPVPQKS